MMAVPTKFAADGKTPTEWASGAPHASSWDAAKLVVYTDMRTRAHAPDADGVVAF